MRPITESLRRLAWFFGIAIASALTTAVVAYGLRAILHAA